MHNLPHVPPHMLCSNFMIPGQSDFESTDRYTDIHTDSHKYFVTAKMSHNCSNIQWTTKQRSRTTQQCGYQLTHKIHNYELKVTNHAMASTSLKVKCKI